MTSRLSILALGCCFSCGACQRSCTESECCRRPCCQGGPRGRPPQANEEARRELAELRERIGELSRRMAELSMQLGDVGPQAYAFRYINDTDRALIGVVLSPERRGPASTPSLPMVRPSGPDCTAATCWSASMARIWPQRAPKSRSKRRGRCSAISNRANRCASVIGAVVAKRRRAGHGRAPRSLELATPVCRRRRPRCRGDRRS